MKTNHTKEEHPKLANKPAVAYNDGDKTIFISWNEYRVEFAVWDRISEYPTDIYQLPLSSYSPTTNIKDEHSDVEGVEEIAKKIYEVIPYNGDGDKPYWKPRGNSLMQDLARRCATSILTSLQEQHEREKREMVREVFKFIPPSYENQPLYSELEIHLKAIAKKHNITL